MLGCGKVSGYGKVDEKGAKPYQGCTSLKPAGAFAFAITYEFPAAASQVQILRNDVVVFQSGNRASTSYVDENLEANETYSYKCQILVNGSIVLGLVGQSGLVADPLSGYDGCTEGTVVNGNSAEISYQFPEGATKAIVARNGAEFFSTSDATVNKATSQELEAGKIYEFTCKVELNGILHEGKTKVTVTVPDPLSAGFRGCDVVQADNATSVSVDYEFPGGADSVTINRDGVNVLTATDGKAGNFIDAPLKGGTQYTYSCVAASGSRTKVGSNVVTLKTPLVPELSYVKKTSNKSDYQTTVNGEITIVPVVNDHHGLATTCMMKPGTPALPEGMALNAATCVVSGAPTIKIDSLILTVVATSSAGTSADAAITFSATVDNPVLSYDGTLVAKLGVFKSFPPTAINGNGADIVSCTVSTGVLPAGLTINQTNCVISGTPTGVPSGPTNIKIIACNTVPYCSNGDARFSVTVTN